MPSKWAKKAARLVQAMRRKGVEVPVVGGPRVAPSGTPGSRKRARIVGGLNGMLFCMCGSQLPHGASLKEIEKQILLAGGMIVPKVRPCTHLILCPDGKDCRKHKEALELRKQVLSYKEFQSLVREALGGGLEEGAGEGEAPPPRKRARTTPTPARERAQEEEDEEGEPPAAVATENRFTMRPEDAIFRI
eukprot:RCo018976